jgi:DNA-binding transcriptional regulator LsrR (DeoR family)
MDIKFSSFTNGAAQEKIRHRLHELNVKDPKTISELARDIGLSRLVVQDFMENGIDITYKSLCTIEKYLREHE